VVRSFNFVLHSRAYVPWRTAFRKILATPVKDNSQVETTHWYIHRVPKKTKQICFC